MRHCLEHGERCGLTRAYLQRHADVKQAYLALHWKKTLLRTLSLLSRHSLLPSLSPPSLPHLDRPYRSAPAHHRNLGRGRRELRSLSGVLGRMRTRNQSPVHSDTRQSPVSRRTRNMPLQVVLSPREPASGSAPVGLVEHQDESALILPRKRQRSLRRKRVGWKCMARWI